MQITYGSETLSTGDATAPLSNLRVNGRQVSEPLDFFSQATGDYLGRGNWRTEVSFTVARSFTTFEDAELFLLTHRDSLPDSADLSCVAGLPGDQTTKELTDAVLSGYTMQHDGLSIVVNYAFLGGKFTAP